VRETSKPLLARANEIAWALLFLLLPFTSAPLLRRLPGVNTVAPITLLPLLWLFLAWFLPYLARRGSLPRLGLPLLGFGLTALIASAYAHLIEVPSLKSRSLLSQEIPALLTLGLGIAYFLITAVGLQNKTRLESSIRWITVGGFLIVLWSLLQALVIWGFDGDFPTWMVELQDWVSLRKLYKTRVTGFAFEPSWLAHQLNLIYIPLWLGATLTKFSSFKFRVFRISLETFLLAGAVLSLVLSLSRVGLLAFLVVLGSLLVKYTWITIRQINARLIARYQTDEVSQRLARIGITMSLILISSLVFISAGLLIGYGLSQTDERLENLFDPEILTSDSLYDFTNKLAFAERVVYWGTGWEIFNDHPFLGVGLGNAGFYFPDKMPAFGWALWETTRLLFRLPSLPNIKSLWVRILTETGLIGFSFFLTWFTLLWFGSRHSYRSDDLMIRTVSLAGQLALIGFLVEGFSIDSFALPYLWTAAGLVTAGVQVYRQSLRT
jgi:hypothetical protein